MNNKDLKAQTGAEKRGEGKKVKKLLFLPAPKRKVGEVLKEEGVVKGEKSVAVGQSSGAVGGHGGDEKKHSASAGQHPASAGQHTPPAKILSTTKLRRAPLSPTLRSGQARGEFPASAGLSTSSQLQRYVEDEQKPVRRPGQVPEVVVERIFLKKLKELSALGVRRRREIKKARLAMILENFHLGDIITNRAVRALLGVSARTASRYLRQLCRQHKLVKFRTDRWTFYRKV